MPQNTSELLARMRMVHPASPRLVWHGQEGRIELSGRVFDNWVAKTSNLLVDELDATPASAVALDLPPHWKSVAIAFACWQIGCAVLLEEDDGSNHPSADPADPDILMTARAVPALAPPGLLVCVALGSLAFRWTGTLPSGAVDFAAEVRAQGDVFLGSSGGDEDPVLVHSGGRSYTASGLQGLVRASPLPVGEGIDGTAGAAGTAVGPDGPATVLIEPGASLLHTLAAAAAVWDQDGTLVLVEEGVEVTGTMLAGERVSSRLEPA